MRELTLVSLAHPEYLEDGQLLLVDHPVLAPLTDGAPDLGWAGDTRLAMYLHLKDQRFICYRLEATNTYAGVAKLPAGAELTNESVNRLIRRLVASDTHHRELNPALEIVSHQDRVAAAARQEHSAFVSELGDKIHYALSRSHLPGVDITRVRNVTTRR